MSDIGGTHGSRLDYPVCLRNSEACCSGQSYGVDGTYYEHPAQNFTVSPGSYQYDSYLDLDQEESSLHLESAQGNISLMSTALGVGGWNTYSPPNYNQASLGFNDSASLVEEPDTFLYGGYEGSFSTTLSEKPESSFAFDTESNLIPLHDRSDLETRMLENTGSELLADTPISRYDSASRMLSGSASPSYFSTPRCETPNPMSRLSSMDPESACLTLPRPSTSRRHVKKIGGFPCLSCERTYDRHRDLQRHVQSTHASRRYTCDLCEKSFHYPKDVRRHRTKHEGLRPYTCPHHDCPYSETGFQREDHLIRHFRTMHNDA